ncbi:MAG: xanthine dehydrogenase small subunit [Pseudomonadota bacterium]
MADISFILDGNRVDLSGVDPTRTVLQYLREDCLRTGSKEGCAEGDCGACTVVVAELEGDELQFRAVNACIQFLPTLDGKALFTVESLKSTEGQLHPVQQSLVDHHASQCGFCTPGFVMSMFALYQNQPSANRRQIDDALSGNLCRCTGYRPIIDACEHMYEYEAPAFDQAALVDQLRVLQSERGVTIRSDSGRYHAPKTLNELAQIYQQHPEAQILAGGTDVGLWVTKQLRDLPQLIYLGAVESLKEVKVDDQGIDIGAAVNLSDAFAAIEPSYPEFAEMFRRFASLPVRNAGTLVGNIANGSPIGDSMPALIAIGTEVVLRQGDRQRRISMESLYLDYMKNAMEAGEFIERIVIPPREPDLQLRCYKLSKRFDQDISAVCAAFALRLDQDRIVDIHIAFGGMAAIPKRAHRTEQALLHQNWNEAVCEAACTKLDDDFTPMSDMRASSDYRARVSANLLRRFYLETRRDNSLRSEMINVFEVSA